MKVSGIDPHNEAIIGAPIGDERFVEFPVVGEEDIAIFEVIGFALDDIGNLSGKEEINFVEIVAVITNVDWFGSGIMEKLEIRAIHDLPGRKLLFCLFHFVTSFCCNSQD